MYKHSQKSRQMKSSDSGALLKPTQNGKRDRKPAQQTNSEVLAKAKLPQKLKPAKSAAKTYRLVPIK